MGALCLIYTHTHTLFNSPTENHDEVHDVPAIPEVGAFMKYEAQRDDLYSSLETEHPNEVGLCFLLLEGIKGRRNNKLHPRMLCCFLFCVCRGFQVWESHQSLGHGRFVLAGKVLLQSQDDTVCNDGGEDHILKWSERLELRSTQEYSQIQQIQ